MSVLQGQVPIGSGGNTVNVVAWDTTVIAPVVIMAGTATQNVNVVNAIAMTATSPLTVTASANPLVVSVSNVGGPYLVTASANPLVVSVSNVGGPYVVTASANPLVVTAAAPLVVTASAAPLVVSVSNVAGPFVVTASANPVTVIPNVGTAMYNGTATAVNYALLAITTSAAAIIVTSAASKVIIVLSALINGNTALNFRFQSAATDIGGPVFVNTLGGGAVLPHNDHGWFKTNSAQSLIGSASASGSVSGCLTYIVVSG